MLTRAFVIWLVLLALAVVNGGVREAVMVPRLGETFAHAISSVTLSATILIVSWFTIEWIRPTSASQAWRVGALWLTLTLAFEFLVGHYVFGNPWNQLWADYNVLKGRLWILVLVTMVSAPWITARVWLGNRLSEDVIRFGGFSPSVHIPPNIAAERIVRFDFDDGARGSSCAPQAPTL